MKKTWCSLLAALTLTFCFSGIILAQETTGSLFGTVKDSAGAAVAGATVTVTDPSKNNSVVRTVTTNDDGVYSVPDIKASPYTVTVEAPNFKKSVTTNVVV
ncbi:MAG TPA: carboxypeptidase-like regulatory domain-containing protein, partial [Pyrinomonadaceae bacterium]|nr:carboxypeptidase-like regulatory domain-containing protein [Pyrinomonadaceae bacterium]